MSYFDILKPKKSRGSKDKFVNYIVILILKVRLDQLNEFDSTMTGPVWQERRNGTNRGCLSNRASKINNRENAWQLCNCHLQWQGNVTLTDRSKQGICRIQTSLPIPIEIIDWAVMSEYCPSNFSDWWLIKKKKKNYLPKRRKKTQLDFHPMGLPSDHPPSNTLAGALD